MATSLVEGRSGGCVHHPERAPIGRCAKCRRPVCGECHTRLEGILHCRDCLGLAAETLEETGPRIGPRLVTFVSALVVLIPALLSSLLVLRGFGLVAGRIARHGAVAFESPANPSAADEAR